MSIFLSALYLLNRLKGIENTLQNVNSTEIVCKDGFTQGQGHVFLSFFSTLCRELIEVFMLKKEI